MKYKAGQRVKFSLRSVGNTVIITNLFSTDSGNLFYYGSVNERFTFCYNDGSGFPGIEVESIEILHNPRMPEPNLIGAAVSGYSGAETAKEIFSRTRANCWYNHSNGRLVTWEEIREPEPLVIKWKDDKIDYKASGERECT